MSTITEIEEAIERLPAEQKEELARWLAARLAKSEVEMKAPVDILSLAGSWEEDPAFDAAILAFEQVDENLWR